MSNEANTPIEEGLRQLRLRYLKQLEERVTLLKKLHENGIQQELHAEDRLFLRALTHKLAGSGSIFGFPLITQSGKALEQALLEQPELSTDRILSLLNNLIEACTEAKSST